MDIHSGLWQVVLMGRRQQFLDQAVEALKAQGIEAVSKSGDVRKEADAQAAVQQAVHSFGKLDILVNCAAGSLQSGHCLVHVALNTVFSSQC